MYELIHDKADQNKFLQIKLPFFEGSYNPANRGKQNTHLAFQSPGDQ